MKKAFKIFSACFLAWFFLFGIPKFFSYQKAKTLIIGAKNNPGSQLLGEIIALILEKKTDYRIKKSFYLEGTYIAYHALESGSIDLYVDYTGSLLLTIFGEKSSLSTKEDYQKVVSSLKKRGLLVLFPLGFQNAYVLLTKQSRPFTKVEDLEGETLSYGFEPEFLARKEFALLNDAYNLSMSKVRTMDASLLYLALHHGDLDVISASSTDGDIARYQAKILQTKEKVFPSYEAICLIKEEVLEEHPSIKQVLAPLKNAFTQKKVREMNEALIQGSSRKQVAKNFLKELGL